MFLGSLISLLVGTIEYLYKEALHTSNIVSETPSRAPGQPPPYIGRNRGRDPAAPHHDLAHPRAAHVRAQLEP